MQVLRPPLSDAGFVGLEGLDNIPRKSYTEGSWGSTPHRSAWGPRSAPHPRNAACSAIRLHTGWDLTPDISWSFSKYMLNKWLFTSQTKNITECSESLEMSCK